MHCLSWIYTDILRLQQAVIKAESWKTWKLGISKHDAVCIIVKYNNKITELVTHT